MVVYILWWIFIGCWFIVDHEFYGSPGRPAREFASPSVPRVWMVTCTESPADFPENNGQVISEVKRMEWSLQENLI